MRSFVWLTWFMTMDHWSRLWLHNKKTVSTLSPSVMRPDKRLWNDPCCRANGSHHLVFGEPKLWEGENYTGGAWIYLFHFAPPWLVSSVQRSSLAKWSALLKCKWTMIWVIAFLFKTQHTLPPFNHQTVMLFPRKRILNEPLHVVQQDHQAASVLLIAQRCTFLYKL